MYCFNKYKIHFICMKMFLVISNTFEKESFADFQIFQIFKLIPFLCTL